MRRALVTLFALIVAISSIPSSEAGQQTMSLQVGASQEIVLARPVEVASVVDAEVADIIVRKSHPERALIQAKTPGNTDVVFKDAAGRIIAHYDIRVGRDIGAVERAIDSVLPGANVRAVGIGGAVYLKGSVRDPGVAETARSIARQHVPEEALHSNLRVASARQVNLRVRVAEVRRSVSKNLGIDSSVTTDDGNAAYGDGPGSGNFAVTQFDSSAAGVLGQALSGTSLGVAGQIGSANLTAILDALQTKGLVRTLAAPNLTATSGETAEMLAGGEIPIPIPQDDGTVAIEYREFGVALTFKPTIKDNGRIALQIRTQVSSLDDANGVTILGTTVPAISKRRASTTVEAPSGGGIAIAGLLQDDIETRIEGASWLTDVPVLGNLFSSSAFQADRSELVVIVTPYLVRPTDPDRLADPAEQVAPPSDVDLFLLRKLSKRYAEGREAPDVARQTMGYMLDPYAGGPK